MHFAMGQYAQMDVLWSAHTHTHADAQAANAFTTHRPMDHVRVYLSLVVKHKKKDEERKNSRTK